MLYEKNVKTGSYEAKQPEVQLTGSMKVEVFLGAVLFWLILAAFFLVLIYGAIRFVKWAWVG